MAQKRREKAAREHRDITQIDVAKAAGVSKGAVSRYESDVDKPRDPVLHRIAVFLDTTAAFLRYGVSEPAAAPVVPHPETAPVEVVPAPKKRGQRVGAYLADKEKAAKKGGRNGGKRTG